MEGGGVGKKDTLWHEWKIGRGWGEEEEGHKVKSSGKKLQKNPTWL